MYRVLREMFGDPFSAAYCWPTSKIVLLAGAKDRHRHRQRYQDSGFGRDAGASGDPLDMPTVTCDGRSFMLDGRRIWLVSGTIPYARIPHESWADRIHAARLAGLNCIDTSVVWSRHEPRPGQFEFSGDNDIRRFVQLVQRAGMYCILRVGPFIGQRHDLGGLPAWLLDIPGIKLRTSNTQFLEACSRYFAQVAEQVRDLQASAPGAGGPILLFGLESKWSCSLPGLAESYLGELQRYLRESGLELQTINDNNLWQTAEGQLDGWSGSENLLSMMRQLAVVRGDQPRIVVDFNLSDEHAVWGRPDPAPRSADALQRRLAEIMAGGGQFNIQPFAGGTFFGTQAGRSPDSIEGFYTSSDDEHAPIGEAGAPGATYQALRRISTFASRFSRVLAHLEPSYQPVVADPSYAVSAEAKSRKNSHSGVKVVHTTGPQGGIVFVFGDEHADPSEPGSRTTSLVLADGSPLPINLGRQSVGWYLLDVNVAGRSRIDFTNLCCLGTAGKIVTLFGPASFRGTLSVNGSNVDVDVPTKGAKTPEVFEHEGLIFVIVNEDQCDQTYFEGEAVFVGVLGVTSDGKPVGSPGQKSCLRVNPAGEANPVPVVHAPEHNSHHVSIAHWTCAEMHDYTKGTSARFAAIDGPASLTTLGAHDAYGWYRIQFPAHGTHKAKLAFPGSGDRLHLFVDDNETAVYGPGPGGSSDASLQLKKGGQRLVVLAEDFGRFCGGMHMEEAKGLCNHIFEAIPLKPGKPKIAREDPIEILAFRAPIWDVREGDCTSPFRLTWSIPRSAKRVGIMIRNHGLPLRAVLIVGGKAIDLLDESGPAKIFISEETLGRSPSTVQLALIPSDQIGLSTEEEVESMSSLITDRLAFDELTENLSEKAEWSFAKWEQPPTSDFVAPKGKPKGPTWWRGTFKLPNVAAAAVPAYLELDGFTKGQVSLNGRPIGRYFIATTDGTKVGPQTRYFVPASYLKAGLENEILIFDEHGGNPGKVRLSFDHEQHPIAAFVRG